MGKIKPALYKGTINRFAISEYHKRLKHYVEITNAINSYSASSNVKVYRTFVRMYRILINARENIEDMIDGLYKARRDVHFPDIKFYPYGKNSPYITKMEYLTRTLLELEVMLDTSVNVEGRVLDEVGYLGLVIRNRTLLEIETLIEKGKVTTDDVDRISNALSLILGESSVDRACTVRYLTLVNEIERKGDTYQHPVYDEVCVYVMDNFHNKPIIGTRSKALMESLREHIVSR